MERARRARAMRGSVPGLRGASRRSIRARGFRRGGKSPQRSGSAPGALTALALGLAADLLELRQHRADVELLGRLFLGSIGLGTRLGRGGLGGQQKSTRLNS